ncbi:MAG: MFS transporter [Candidatus Eremiobacteraeota bacterium]|nr:MFS transporter [Candidatus Eremiobacteraeota bacterium]MCW5871937.1 MFS transporter [Candidatus Eremiobacteraeota bacterium]
MTSATEDSWPIRLAPAAEPATLAPPPASTYRVPPGQVTETFRYWRHRLLWSTYVGYAVFYFLRNSLTIALPVMGPALGITKSTFGIFFTLNNLAYGFAKLISGIAADRYNPRVLLVAGLGVSALANIVLGSSQAVMVLGIFFVINGLAQGFGFPPCARVLSYWYAPRERGLYWGIFNTSHQIGQAAILGIGAFLASRYGWQYAFWVPALVGVLCCLMLWNRVRDTPASLGLPSVEDYHLVKEGGMLPEREEAGPIGFDTREAQGLGSVSQEEAQEPTADIVRRRVWRNPAVWLVCLGNFFVYVVRGSFLQWAPTFLKDSKQISLVLAGSLTMGFEVAGLAGCLVSGWVTDRFLGGRRAPACVIWMVMCSIFVFAFWKSDSTNPLVYGALLAGVGFAVYGPQFLVGVMVADLATKRAAGTAVGLSGIFGYASALLSGGLVGYLVDHYGWNAFFELILAGSVLACIPFLLTWNAKAPEE